MQGHQPEPLPRISFVMIVLNGMPFIEAALNAIYEQAHQVIVVEGAVENGRFAANPDGGSIDGTTEFLASYPDPMQKLTVIRGLWPEKLEMQNRALEEVSGDYVWLVDSDEVYSSETLLRISQILSEDPGLTQVDFIPDNFWKGFDHLFVSDKFFEPSCHYRRIFKYAPGSTFTTHRPPTLLNAEMQTTTDQGKVLTGTETRNMGLTFNHYSYVLWSQVYQKIELYHRYGWGDHWGVDLDAWYRECFLCWTPGHRADIERTYPVWAGDADSRTVPFEGEHPSTMHQIMSELNNPGSNRVEIVSEEKAMEVIGASFHQARVRDAWSLIKLDDPLEKRDALITENIKNGACFWNIHVALSFMASTLKPTRYLEVGVRSGGSLVQVLNASRPMEATAVDMWGGEYAGMPNTLEYTRKQFEDFSERVGGCTPIRYHRGSSHDILKSLIASGEKFDLINIDGDHSQDGAWEDLEDAIQLLGRRGAIVFDDITHPAHRDLLTLVYRLVFRYPEFSVLLNTTQENGCAIFLRGISFEELEQRSRVLQERKVRVAGDIEEADGGNLTMIGEDSDFAREISKLLDRIKPKQVIESGTYHGEGTTRVIAEWFAKHGSEESRFYSIECNRHNLEIAKQNLQKRNLLKQVTLVPGISVPRNQLPSFALIREKYVDSLESEDLVIDHRESVRAKLYHRETAHPGLPENCLGRCLEECDGSPDFVLLDSGGHLGNTEFNVLIEQLKAECTIALDDVRHVKHHRSLRQIQSDPRFELITSSDEKFGFCIARFTPTCAGGPEPPKKILWIRTDSIGDNVLSLPLLKATKGRYENSWITVICQEQVADLYRACPFVDEVLTFDRQRAQIDEEYCQVVVERLQELNADLCLNPVYSRERVTDLLALGSRAPRRIAYLGNDWNIDSRLWSLHNRYYTDLVTVDDVGGGERAYMQAFLRVLDPQAELPSPEFWLSREDELFAEQVFAENGFDPQKTAVLFAGAQGRIRISTVYGTAMGESAELDGFSLIALGGFQDKGVNQENIDDAGLPSINLCGETTLGQAAALIKMSRVAIGAETGLAHIAAAVGTPHVILVGGGHFGRFLPYSDKTVMVTLPLDCFGCRWECRFDKAYCVSEIRREPLIRALKAALENVREKPLALLQGRPEWEEGGEHPGWAGARVVPACLDVEIAVDDKEISDEPVEGTHHQSNQAGLPRVGRLLGQMDYEAFLAHHMMSFGTHPLTRLFYSLLMAKQEGRTLDAVLRRAVNYHRRLFGGGL